MTRTLNRKYQGGNQHTAELFLKLGCDPSGNLFWKPCSPSKQRQPWRDRHLSGKMRDRYFRGEPEHQCVNAALGTGQRAGPATTPACTVTCPHSYRRHFLTGSLLLTWFLQSVVKTEPFTGGIRSRHSSAGNAATLHVLLRVNAQVLPGSASSEI